MPNSIQVSSFQLPDVNYSGAIVTLRRYYTVNWTDQDGVLHLAGRPGSRTDAFDEIDCTLANHTLTVPAFTAAVTLFNGANPYAREVWQLWDQANKARNIITGDSGWFIPDSPNPTTRSILEIINQGQFLLWPPNIYLNEVGVLALIEAHLRTLGVSGIATMSSGVAVIPRTTMTAGGAARGSALTPMTGALYADIDPGVGFSIISTDGGDEGDILWTAYDNLS